MKTFFALLLTLNFFLGSAQAQVSPEAITGLETSLGAPNFFSAHLTGFMLYDLEEKQVIYEKNSHLRFIPASTTKLLTLYASLLVLQDSTHTLRYVSSGDTLKIWGAGDPSWKYKKLAQPNFKQLISAHSVVQFSDANQVSPSFGYGWQWDDYYYDYSAERSSLPMYGNLVEVVKNDSLQLIPSFFQSQLKSSFQALPEVQRDFHSNNFFYNPRTFVGKEKFIPFLVQPQVLASLASQELGIPVIYQPDSLPVNNNLWRAGALAPILKEMMVESDNFLAEQLLFMVSDKLFQTLDSERAIEYVKKTALADLPDAPKWVDGSGLSRHNLLTPRSLVRVVEKLIQLIPEEQLGEYLAVGGKTGTLKNSFQAAEPYVFAKTGSMSHSYNLAGIVKTRSGKTYAFAFMNTNFPYPVSTVRKEVEKVMLYIKDHF